MMVDLVPPQAVAESLAESLRPFAAGASMLLVRAASGRDTLPDTLTGYGGAVTLVEAYRNVIPGDSIEQLRVLFQDNPPDAITFTSGSTAHNLAALLQEAKVEIPKATVMASIGPITSQAMRDLGMEPTVEAVEATISGLVAALMSALVKFEPAGS